MNEIKIDPKMLSLISHELRAPLAAIRGYVSLLNTGAFGEMSEEAKNSFSQMDISVIREIYLVHDFGFFLKLYFGEQLQEAEEKMNILEKVQSVTDFYAKEESKSRKAVFEITGPENIEIVAHPWILGTAITFLLKYAVRGGEEGATINVNVIEKESGFIISVKDNNEKMKITEEEAFGAPQLGSVERSGIELLVASIAIQRLDGYKVGIMPEYKDGNVFYIHKE